MDKIFKWGILGCGKIARKFASDILSIDNASIYAVASRSKDRALEFGKEFETNICLGSHEDLTKIKELDAVYIATRHPLHFRNSIMMLEAGIPVLCEKPIAINCEELDKMIDCAKSNNTFLMEAIWTLFLPFFQKMQKLISSGRIGEIRTIDANFSFNLPFNIDHRLYNPNHAGGALLDIGIYTLLYPLFFLGKPDDIQSTAVKSNEGVDIANAIILKHQSALSTLYSSIHSLGTNSSNIAGTKGGIVIHPRFHESHKISLYTDDFDTQEEIHCPFDGWGYHYEARHVMKCIQEQKIQSDICTWNLSKLLSQTMDTVRKQNDIVYDSDL